MKNYFKINYVESVLLIIGFSLINFLNIIFRKLLIFINFPEKMMFSVSYAFPFIFLFLLISYRARKKNFVINFSMKMSPWYIYILLFFMMLGIIIVNELFTSLIPREGPLLGNMYKEIEEFLKEEIKNPIPFFSTTVLLAPICEEILFRGIILNGMLKNNIHPLKAILFSSFLFGITHMNPWQFIGGFFIGNLIGFVYYITSSIINCILLHVFNNGFALFTMILFMKYEINIPEKINSNYWSIFILGIITLISGTFFLMKKRKQLT
ncbi:type II CAAX endopeptidase family protein [Blattabacterium cuenoti]|uniref:type II CAAX endopeptidase family protein n=1 Tax=Blattabacterium cuenoti TaxID=1653831 RepID=UPI00163CA816|nr:type II CAAX endopeptidase family protein [Blattabacterium cuenoti]